MAAVLFTELSTPRKALIPNARFAAVGSSSSSSASVCVVLRRRLLMPVLRLIRTSPTRPPEGACPLQVRITSATLSEKPSGRMGKPTELAEQEYGKKVAGCSVMTYARPAIVMVPASRLEAEFAATEKLMLPFPFPTALLERVMNGW